MRNINRPANSFTVTGDAEYKHAGNKVSLALCPLSRGLIFFRRWALVEYIPGHVYFVKDEFFDLVQDPYLMKYYPETKRPHYYAIQDRKTGLFWMIPCSSKVDKYKGIIARQKKAVTL
jgi:hypothetical protein